MVGDSVEDDIEGALALGMRAFLLDRDGRFPDFEPRIDDLRALPAALGLSSAPGSRSAAARRRAAAASAVRPGEADPHRRGVVVTRALAQPAERVRAVDEHVDPRRHAGDLHVLAVEMCRVEVGVAGRRALFDRARDRGDPARSCRGSAAP